MKHYPYTFREFRGGLDLASALPNVEDGYTPNAFNFTLNDLGGIEKIAGYEDLVLSGANLPGNQQEIFSFVKSDGSYSRLITADDDSWYAIENDGTTVRIRTGMSPNNTASFVVHNDVLYGLDDDNDFASWDGSTLNTYAPGGGNGPNHGRIIGIWNGRMFIVRASNQLRLEWSEPFDFASATAWPSDNFVELTTIGSGSKIMGGAIVGDALVLVTDAAIIRITNPDSGANTIIANIGTTSGKSLAVIDNVLYGVNRKGIFSTDGNSFAGVFSDKIDPLFLNRSSDLSGAAGLSFDGRYYVSIGLASLDGDSSSDNLTTLEVYASLGNAIMANGYRAFAWTSSTILSGRYTAWFIDSIDRTKIRRAFRTNYFLDDSNAEEEIECWYELPPSDFGDPHHQKRLHKVRIIGRGSALSVGAKIDYSTYTPSLSAAGLPDSVGALWDVDLWDSGLWGGLEYKEVFVPQTGRGREFGIYLYEKSGGGGLTSSSGDSEVGVSAVYIVEPMFSISRRYR